MYLLYEKLLLNDFPKPVILKSKWKGDALKSTQLVQGGNKLVPGKAYLFKVEMPITGYTTANPVHVQCIVQLIGLWSVHGFEIVFSAVLI